MSKRQADQADFRDQNKAAAFGNGNSRHATEEKNEMGEFEDAWEDDMEEEEIVEDTNEDDDEEGGAEGNYYFFRAKNDGALLISTCRYGSR